MNYTPTLESADSLKSQPSMQTPTSSLHLPVGGLGGEQTDRWIQYKTPYNVVSISACEKYLCCVDSKVNNHFLILFFRMLKKGSHILRGGSSIH